MSLLPIARALGGVVYAGGTRAAVPGPGHSAEDRSVSLWLTHGRVVVHSFGRSSWRQVVEDLRARGLLDADGRPRPSADLGAGAGRSAADPPDLAHATRREAAARLWSEAQPLLRRHALLHIRLRRVFRPAPVSLALRHHGGAPLAVYAGRGPRRPALLAAVSDAEGALCAVEVTYLDPNGARAAGLALSRKVVGVLPPACAVRLDPSGPELLVGEGVFTTLSASARFGLPGWALLSTRNLRTWTAPSHVRRVLIAADRGEDGERSARLLHRRLVAQGLATEVVWPPSPASDWNEAAPDAEPERVGEGGSLGGTARSPP